MTSIRVASVSLPLLSQMSSQQYTGKIIVKQKNLVTLHEFSRLIVDIHLKR